MTTNTFSISASAPPVNLLPQPPASVSPAPCGCGPNFECLGCCEQRVEVELLRRCGFSRGDLVRAISIPLAIEVLKLMRGRAA